MYLPLGARRGAVPAPSHVPPHDGNAAVAHWAVRVTAGDLRPRRVLCRTLDSGRMHASDVDLAPGPVRVVLIVLTLLTVVAAGGGAAYLLGAGTTLGTTDIADTRLGPLGFGTWAPGGVFLAVGVALPMLAAGVLLWAGHPWGPLVALLAGLALACWIVVQVALIGFSSWLQPALLVVAVTVAGGGMLLVRAS